MNVEGLPRKIQLRVLSPHQNISEGIDSESRLREDPRRLRAHLRREALDASATSEAAPVTRRRKATSPEQLPGVRVGLTVDEFLERNDQWFHMNGDRCMLRET